VPDVGIDKEVKKERNVGAANVCHGKPKARDQNVSTGRIAKGDVVA
jgi:hypothetical protein